MNSIPVRRNYIVNNEEILILINAWRSADKNRKAAIATSLVGRLGFLVHSKIRAHKGLPIYDDLLQEGRIGIMRALEDFRLERGKNFFMFANWHIQTRVRRFIMREMRRRETPVGDALMAECASETQDGLEVCENKKTIMRALSFLSDGDRRVLIMRFGFNGEEPRTFQQIGNALGISKQRAQQIEANALQRLRKSHELKQLFCGTSGNL
jgi:RNA polymerase sigma factor (sigma-70 family)